MLEKDATLGTVKHPVLLKVAELAFKGELDEKVDQIPDEIIPGPKAQFRCCIYREREIIRERVRLAKGLEPGTGNPCKNTVQVIPAACEGCPITRFVVTDNCQKCMMKEWKSMKLKKLLKMLRKQVLI